MKTIELIKDKNCNIDLKKFKAAFERLSTQMAISIVEENYDLSDRLITYPRSHKEQKQACIGRIETDFALLVTDIPYDNNYFFEEFKGFTIISFYGWEDLTTLPRENGLWYFICVLALGYFPDEFPEHTPNIGCLNDFLSEKKGIDLGMRQASLCKDCQRILAKMKLPREQNELLVDIRKLLDYLSQKSRWNESIVDKSATTSAPTVSKRKPLKKKTINILIASPSDVQKERELLLNYLERNFRIKGYEKATKHRITTAGWEDLAAQHGYPQDVINAIILPEIDIVVGVLKHKLGTPTVDQAGKKRAESGTAEEIYYALESDDASKVLCMVYFFSTPPVISLDDPQFANVKNNWDNLKTFKDTLKAKLIFKPYTSEDELLSLVTADIARNIEIYFE